MYPAPLACVMHVHISSSSTIEAVISRSRYFIIVAHGAGRGGTSLYISSTSNPLRVPRPVHAWTYLYDTIMENIAPTPMTRSSPSVYWNLKLFLYQHECAYYAKNTFMISTVLPSCTIEVVLKVNYFKRKWYWNMILKYDIGVTFADVFIKRFS